MVTDFYPPFVGGVEVLVSGLGRELSLRGHDVAVATLAAPGLPAYELDGDVRVHRIRSTTAGTSGLFANAARPWAPPGPDPRALAGLREVLRRESPDVVHGHDWLARSYLPLKRRGGPALAMSLHYFTLSCPKKNLMYDDAPCSGPRLGKCLACAGRHYGRPKGTAVVLAHRAFSRAEAALVDVFLPVSKATAAGNGLKPGATPRYEIVPNLVPRAPDAGPHAELLAGLPEQPYLLFVGDVRADKGIHVLLDAHGSMSDPPPLVLIGKVWPQTPPIPRGVLLLRDWPNAAVREAMRRCLALVAPSVWPEPFGIVVVEALAAGRPVVASAIGGIPEIVRDEREGLLVAPSDPAALAGALEKITRDAGLREALAARTAERARAYLPEGVVPLVEAAYERIVRRRAARS